MWPASQGAVAGDGENCSWFLAEEGSDKNVFVPSESYWLPSLDRINAENARGVVCAGGYDERAAAVPVNTHYVITRPPQNTMELEGCKLALESRSTPELNLGAMGGGEKLTVGAELQRRDRFLEGKMS